MRNLSQAQFVSQFINAVTVRPFLEDLRRIKQHSNRFAMPAVAPAPAVQTEAA